MQQAKVAFIGGGQMATALIGGAVDSQFLSPTSLSVVESSAERRGWLTDRFPGIRIEASLAAAGDSQQIVLAVKPQVLREIGATLQEQIPGDHLWISIAAGVSLSELQSLLKTERVIRVMPNTPAQVGAGAAALSAPANVGQADIVWVKGLMESVGMCVVVPESQMHAVTGVAGSSPAYVYMIIEALADAGVSSGLSREISLRLSAQAVLGAAKMVLETGAHPGQLKDQVTSPAGTTIAALRTLESAGVRSAMIEAVAACVQRSKELEQAGRS